MKIVIELGYVQQWHVLNVVSWISGGISVIIPAVKDQLTSTQ